MDRRKKIAAVLLIVGVFIPSFLYPFASVPRWVLTNIVNFGQARAAYPMRVGDLEVALVRGKWVEHEEGKVVGGHYKGRVAIPYRYILAFGITLSFVGISLIVFSPGQKQSA